VWLNPSQVRLLCKFCAHITCAQCRDPSAASTAPDGTAMDALLQSQWCWHTHARPHTHTLLTLKTHIHTHTHTSTHTHTTTHTHTHTHTHKQIHIITYT
jgi:hypothetical protein